MDDTKEMYHQVLASTKYRDILRFLWHKLSTTLIRLSYDYIFLGNWNTLSCIAN